MTLTSNPHKIVLLGETGVGKTTLALRFSEGENYNNPEPTIAVAFHSKTIEITGESVKLQLWDTAGQEMYRSLIPMYIRNAEAAVIVYDITNLDSFNKIETWIEDIVSFASRNVIICIVGNKFDLNDARNVQNDIAHNFALQNNYIFFETSARTGVGVDSLFIEIAKQLHSLAKKDPHSQEEINDNQKINELVLPKKKCC
ncbi:hypothetical protein M0811_00041 [Anaeramoeba ignava]|uniref:Small GTP-binding protein n=1 Tax=Anaeramoeba ignava TaxID=1746090 RepID=A0A9Q0RFG5_ANAIG|nr:hypothetical protein M0811_00041 [Anaeramoeba ignava]